MLRWEILDSRTVSPQALEQALAAADERRRQKTAALARAQDRRVSLCADLLSRRLLSEASGAEPRALRFCVAENGKPQPLGLALHFNLSHSGPFVACAVDTHPVGIDLECFRPLSPALKKRICAASELAFVGEDERKLIQLWTLKEAFLKYTGAGISGDLRSVCVVHGGRLALPGLSVISELTAEYALSIAYEGE